MSLQSPRAGAGARARLRRLIVVCSPPNGRSGARRGSGDEGRGECRASRYRIDARRGSSMSHKLLRTIAFAAAGLAALAPAYAQNTIKVGVIACLLYTSDAADERSS